MIHEGGFPAVELKSLPKDIRRPTPGFLINAGGRGIIPEASAALFRFGQLKVATGPVLQGMHSIHDRTTKLDGLDIFKSKLPPNLLNAWHKEENCGWTSKLRS